MRFRKKIKIAKGLSLNISKSGLSTSIGSKGYSTTIGNKGTYLNYGIPGTGVYNRKKISFSSNDGMRKNNDSRSIQEKDEILIKLSENNSGKIEIFDMNEEIITDQSLLRRIKKLPEYNEKISELKNKILNEINDTTDDFINIHKLTPEIKSEKFWVKECESLIPDKYIKKNYEIDCPTLNECKIKLQDLSKSNVKSLFFWTNETKRTKYVEDNLDSFYQEEIDKWKKAESDFRIADEEMEKQIKLKNKNIEIIKNKIKNQVLTGNPEYIIQEMEHIFSEFEMPVEMSVDLEFIESNNISLNVVLPEKQNMPEKQANILKSGKLSIKTKAKKELNHDYATCIHGLAFFIAGVLFNVSPKISLITINGFVKELSIKTGNVEEKKLFEVEFDREGFLELNILKLNPIEGFENFKHQRKLLKTFDMKNIG